VHERNAGRGDAKVVVLFALELEKLELFEERGFRAM
jgi:hypothetical protein